jgi:hypothetical protein
MGLGAQDSRGSCLSSLHRQPQRLLVLFVKEGTPSGIALIPQAVQLPLFLLSLVGVCLSVCLSGC